MPDFHKISFDADELDVLRSACACRSGHEERLFDETAGGSIESIVAQEWRTDDMLLIKSTVAIFKPGQTILITKEDLCLMRDCLQGYKAEAEKEHSVPIDSAIKKIETALLPQ
jgi:hypothetical protein